MTTDANTIAAILDATANIPVYRNFTNIHAKILRAASDTYPTTTYPTTWGDNNPGEDLGWTVSDALVDHLGLDQQADRINLDVALATDRTADEVRTALREIAAQIRTADVPDAAQTVAKLRTTRTVRQIAADLGCATSTVYRWASGISRPSACYAAALAAL